MATHNIKFHVGLTPVTPTRLDNLQHGMGSVSIWVDEAAEDGTLVSKAVNTLKKYVIVIHNKIENESILPDEYLLGKLAHSILYGLSLADVRTEGDDYKMRVINGLRTMFDPKEYEITVIWSHDKES